MIGDRSPSVASNHSQPAGEVEPQESKSKAKEEAGHGADSEAADDSPANEPGHPSKTEDAPRIIHQAELREPTIKADAAPVEETSGSSSPLLSIPSNLSELKPPTEVLFNKSKDKAEDEAGDETDEGKSEAEDNPRHIRRVMFGLPQSTQAPSLSSDGTFALPALRFKLRPQLYFSKPHVVFDARSIISAEIPRERFVLRRRHVPDQGSLKTMAVYVDGACESSNFGKLQTISPPPIGDMTNPGGVAQVYLRTEKAGCCFIFGPGDPGTKTFALERKGPDGELHKRTKTRAQLRAALAALHYRAWYNEGWEEVVLITSSTYLVKSGTDILPKWWARDWVTSGNHDVKNRDLWKEISCVMGDYAQHGCKVSFWWVSEDSNRDALEKAEAAVAEPDGDGFVKLVG
ncbi:hypothetical protein IWX90DRAFT_204525 [Phyllosticta citrichinensis]|uniref:RNase H type-1 domain-containing protein n=1 Tax=Phyllosticta citrichinensis TaxID=1130410 RepID=A0ABR1XSG3_9PEZI